MGNSTWELFSQANSYHTSSDASLFLASLPVLANEKLNINELNRGVHLEGKKSLVDDEKNHAIESLLPDENELFAGMVNELVDDSEDFDLFRSGGGLELETDLQENFVRFGVSSLNLSDGVGVGNGGARLNFPIGGATIAGEHPLGEHPSRTLFVRNINSNVEDAEIRALFEQYGDIRTLYTSCKHRGFVMISYYDIRAARTAMRALQNKPLRRRKLDIHFSIPKENPSDKDMNQGTLVVFNLDPSVSSDDLLQIFGPFGEVKEVRETPNKRNHKFVEFYDVRAAEAALKSLNRIDIAGKRIKLEPSRPGGARRSSLLQASNDLEQDERSLYHVGSPLGNSPSGNWPQLGSPMERNPLKNYSKSPVFGSISPPLVHDSSSGHYFDHIFPNGNLNSRAISDKSRSFPEHILGSQYRGAGPVSSFGQSSFSGPTSNPLFAGPQNIWGNTNSNSFNFLNHHYHVGSAPPERQFGYIQESLKGSFMGPGYGSVGSSYGLNCGSNMPSGGRLSPAFLGNGYFPSMEGLAERKSRLFGVKGVQLDNMKQFQLDLDKIKSGEDARTTLMIKNIPNKYSSEMLLAAVDENHRGAYDFLYLPIDFKNRCNVGYAFINMLSPLNIVPFHAEFEGKRWEKFNSEKVASLAFARIQGKAALVAHFQNSSLMNEDKRCRPILFDLEHTGFSDEHMQENLRAYCSSSQPWQTNGPNEK
ncbi:MEI2-like protein 5 [Striga asiatica]|uniref:MEI2-like protein 5 n=1 Tax=Striga asiatica TaxID=4170 RepID=A0A5A7QCG7_STRAF|nr:MEI2-like protein 5 [Striga asiatica]